MILSGVVTAQNVRYEPTPVEVAHAMLELAQVTSGDVVYDLGCGDGRIVIAAVVRFGARGVCVDIDSERIAESRENAPRGRRGAHPVSEAGPVCDRLERRYRDHAVPVPRVQRQAAA
jgi:predicted RNA methylase